MKRRRIQGKYAPKYPTYWEHMSPVVGLVFTATVCATLLYAKPKVADTVVHAEMAGEASTSAGQTMPSPVPSPTPSPLIVPGDKWNEFIAAVDRVAPIYNYPKNVVLAQAALESARGSSRYAVERNNFLGINAVDDNPDLAYTFENPEQCVVEYMRIIRKNFPEAWAHRDNPEMLLQLLKNNKRKIMYATDRAYVSKVMSMKEWNQ